MQTQRTTIKKTRRGKVLKSVTEHYLRDDIYCGLKGCTVCEQPDASCPLPCELPESSSDESSPLAFLQQSLKKQFEENSMNDSDLPLDISKTWEALEHVSASTPLVLIPDQTVYSNQMDLLETHTAPFANIIVLQSVLDNMSNKHYKTFQRMRALTKVAKFQIADSLPANFTGQSKSSALGSDVAVLPRAHVFSDLHHRATYTQASAIAGVGDTSLRTKYNSVMERAVQGQQELDTPSTDDDDEYADPVSVSSMLQPLVKVIQLGSAAAALNQEAGSQDSEKKDDEAALVLSATKWYQRHFGTQAFVLLLTNDESLSHKAAELNVSALSAERFVKAYAERYPRLPTVLAQTIKDSQVRDRSKWVYEAHLDMEAMKRGVTAGDLYKGTFDVNRDYWTEASVMTSQFGRVLISDFQDMNRAINGDTVVIQMLPKDQWKAPSAALTPDAPKMDGVDESVAEAVLTDMSAETLKMNDDFVVELEKTAATNSVPTGKVVGVWERNNRNFCGALELTDKKDGRVFCLPVNKRIPKILIESKQISDLLDKRVMVAFDSWPINSKHPLGHLVKTLGTIGDQNAETEVLLLEHEIKHDRWSVAVEACLPPLDYEISDAERAGRVDLRDVNICSIDPPGCTDIDDALHCIDLGDGTYEVGVHIADVTHYVKPGSALDLEAAARSTSVYLVDRRIDMIPARLSTNLCSLRGGEERLAFSTVWRVNSKAEILETKFFKSVILSKAALTYAEAQARIDQQHEDNDPVTHACKNLMMLARKIKQRRIDQGALTLASSEVKFQLSEDRTSALEVGMYQTKEANSLVEEFMLLANVSVAEHILRAFPTMALLRRHPTPAPEMLDPLVKAARSWGYDMDITNGKTLSDSLDRITDPSNPMFNKVVRMLTTRCMTQAKYMSSGEFAEKAFTHFGLACPTYTHFTSPIRRYADIIAHRLLATSLGIAPLPDAIKDKAHMRDVVDNLNHRHSMAQLASRASTQVWTMLYFTGKDVIADALVLAVRSTGVRVLVPKYGIECAIRLVPKQHSSTVVTKQADVPVPSSAKYVYDPDSVCLNIGSMKLRILQELQVRICVKENKMRRRWLHVELAGELKEQLDVIIESFTQGDSFADEDDEASVVKPTEEVKMQQAEIKLDTAGDEEVNQSTHKGKKRKTK